MNTKIQVFNHEQFGQIRICLNEGKEWFCLSDVCKALEINNPRDVKKRLQQRGVVTIDTPTYNQHGTMVMQEMTYIDEANLYRCIFQSRKQEAEQFQNWVFEVVLPQIRKTGGYIPVSREDDEKTILAKAVKILMRTVEVQKQELAEQDIEIARLALKAEYAEEVLTLLGAVSLVTLFQVFSVEHPASRRRTVDDAHLVKPVLKLLHSHRERLGHLRHRVARG